MNVPPFAIPGLFPTTSPISEGRLYSFPDGSVSVTVYEGAKGIVFSSCITTANGRVLLRDELGTHVFTEEIDAETDRYNFVLDGETEALPVGTYRLDVYGSVGLRTFLLTNTDNPFNKGQNSKYSPSKEDNSVFVVRGNRLLQSGITGDYIQFPRPFSVSPGLVAINVLKDGALTDVAAYVVSVNAEGFNVSFATPIPEDGVYSVEWAIWTKATPLLLTPLLQDIGPYYTEPLY